MPDPIPTPSFSMLLQRFFVEHLGRQRAVSPRTIAAYRDTFRLLLRARQEITFTVTRGRGIICAGGKRGHATGEIRGAVPAFG